MRKGGMLYYFHADHLGTASTTTNQSGGAAIYQTRAYPYGVTRWQSGTDYGDYDFTAQRRDNFGLLDYRARFYDPLIGRFISADSVVPDFANPQSLNRYGYTYNNPVKYTDPSGHCVIEDASCDFENPDVVDYPKFARKQMLSNMVWHEQRSEGPEVWIRAAQVAQNREGQGEWKGKTLHEILDQPNQFSCSGPKTPDDAFYYDEQSGSWLVKDSWRDVWSIVSKVVEGDITDPTGGDVFFANVTTLNHPADPQYSEKQVYESTLLSVTGADDLNTIGYEAIEGNFFWFVSNQKTSIPMDSRRIEGYPFLQPFVKNPVLPQ